MAMEAKAGHDEPAAEEPSFAHLRATPEGRSRILALAPPPFDAEAWQRGAVPPTPEELADLEEFLQDREAQRQLDLKHLEERLADLDR